MSRTSSGRTRGKVLNFPAVFKFCSSCVALRFYQNMLNLPDDDWNDLGREHKGPGKEPPTVHRTSTDSCDSGYASQSSNTVRARKGKASTSLTSDNNNCTLVRRFWVFHAVKV